MISHLIRLTRFSLAIESIECQQVNPPRDLRARVPWARSGSGRLNHPQLNHKRRSFKSTTEVLVELGRIKVQKVPFVGSSHRVLSREKLASGSENHHQTGFESKAEPTIWKPMVFCLSLTAIGFGLAVDLTNRDTAQKVNYLREHQGSFPNWFSKSLFNQRMEPIPSDAQLQQLRKLERLNSIKRLGLNHVLPHQILTWYINLGEGQQVCLVLGLVNLAVFSAWQMPRMIGYMSNHFTHHPLSGKSYTLLSSTFSHSTLLHFGFNMLALYSIGSTAHDSLTHRLRASRDVDPVRIPESTPTYHFLAFYLFAGLAAGMGSHALSLLIRAPRLIKWRQGVLKSSTPPIPILPSLGASGAIYGCLTMTALAFPEAHVSLIFLPWIPIKIGNAVFFAVMLDFIGVIRSWRHFDHMAHLCGGLAGLIWYFSIDKWFDRIRLRYWKLYKNKE
ncbi:hypothetical protein BY996DRAFT_4580425 [Phakopsora pachyrhizi]|uniref:Peptidase S54 rhomboid domain-containing protein n=1 Tax=Phakopsora pachyrhizi TaxID=170000 RepID=A0AAV0BJR1_PHAPC|nr:hypothetical protein BY996DRAFT_4580425 [Phakopsora pachyrhizi]CAH7686914.1 hypothetical protein PPACK8108_LOCUS21625 [Phakopsora pachyrhizi]